MDVRARIEVRGGRIGEASNGVLEIDEPADYEALAIVELGSLRDLTLHDPCGHTCHHHGGFHHHGSV